jgi:HSP20 family protein
MNLITNKQEDKTMTLIRRVNNNYPLFQNWMEDFFGNFDSNVSNKMRTTVPAVNIAETENSFEIAFAAPGLTKSDFSIHLENDVLTVKSEKAENQSESNTNFTRKEFNFSSFQRSFTLPEAADGENIKAEYLNGILNIEIPKKEEAKAKPAREIAIV